jgi:hypothetical protein
MRLRLIALCFLCLGCGACSCIFESSPNVTPTPTPTPVVSPLPSKPTPTPNDEYLRNGIKEMVDESKTLMSWALALIGASVAAIASSSYFRPTRTRWRLMYLLFVFGWAFMGLSIANADKISRRYPAAAFAQQHDRLREIGYYINVELDCQLWFLRIGLICFGIWLIAFILWWVFARSSFPDKSKNGG